MLVDESTIVSDLKKEEERFKKEISGLRTGKPSLQVFESIFVDYYGAPTAVSYMGSPTQNGLSRTWKIFDRNMTQSVLDAIVAAQLGASVNQSDPVTINVNFVPMTQEVRMQQVKELNALLEDARVKVRQNVRRKYMEEISSMDKVSEDDQKRSEEKVQELVDKSIANLEEIAKVKEIDIMAV